MKRALLKNFDYLCSDLNRTLLPKEIMKKILTLALLSTLNLGALAQSKPQIQPRITGVDIAYAAGERPSQEDEKKKDKKRPQTVTTLRVRGTQSVVEPINRAPQEMIDKELAPPVSLTYVNIADSTQWQVAQLYDGREIANEAKVKGTNGYSVVAEDIEVAGWKCTQLRTSINSNTIDIWYTDDMGLSGSPMPAWGVPEGVVLKVVRNGRVMLEAENIVRSTKKENLGFDKSEVEMMDVADFNYEMRQSVVKTVSVFDNQTIGFVGGKAPESITESEKVYVTSGGTVVLKKVKLPENPEDYSIFAEVVQYSDGDAYDRTGSIFVIPTGKEIDFLDALSSEGLKALPSFKSDKDYPGVISTDSYDVPAELMRFFTTFGVRKFNHIKVKGQDWADSVLYKQEISHLRPLLKDSAWIAAYIGNWDSKGHKLSLDLKYYPGGRRQNTKSLPLFNTLNIMEQGGQTYPTFFGSDSLRMNFTIKEDMKNTQLVYITTGHGGWGGGDEFNPKLNTVRVDGKVVSAIVPWREDCASYRNWNPCSGNFSNGLSSSDLSRSNWCPGTVTYPYYIPLGDLKAGEHTLSVQIPQGESEGGSFSYWCISGVLIGN